MDFFQRIKAGVKSKNTTIESFLDTVFHGEVSRDSYNGWKKRQGLPRADYVIKIAAALGVTVEYLVTGESPEGLPPETLSLARKIAALPSEDREEILALIGIKRARRASK
jgi:transcriptional regulator with XRE-family HTH domain